MVRARKDVPRLMPDDFMLLEWLTRYSYMTLPQLSRLAARPYEAIRRRVQVLCRAGFAQRQAWLRGSADLIVPTRQGIMAAGHTQKVNGINRPTYSPPRVRPGMVNHTVWIADTAITYHLLGRNVMSERDVYRYEIAGREHHFLDTYDYAVFTHENRQTPYVADLYVLPDDPSAAYHPANPQRRPGGLSLTDRYETRSSPDGFWVDEDSQDLTVGDQFSLPDGHSKPWAIEIELSGKRPLEYNRILEGYAGAKHLSGVTWLTPHAEIHGLISRSRDTLIDEGTLTQDQVQITELLPWEPIGTERVA